MRGGLAGAKKVAASCLVVFTGFGSRTSALPCVLYQNHERAGSVDVRGRDDPFRVLKLLAVLFGVILLIPENIGEDLGASIVEIAVGYDNQSNEALLRKGATTKFHFA